MSPSHSPSSAPHHTQSPSPSPSPSPSSSPSPSPSPPQSPSQSPSPDARIPTLAPLNTNAPNRRAPLQRPPSYAKSRMSTFSTTSKHSHGGSRPVSYAFPAFHSSLSYALVRDFAYPIVHPWHYGPPPEVSEPPSGNTTPASERQRRSSDPANATWDGANPQWSAGPWGGDGFFSNQQLPQMAYGDGPPYSEDDDLHSPVVVSSRHKKNKSTFATTGSRSGKVRGRSPQQDVGEEDEEDLPPNHEGARSYFGGTNGDGTETYYIGDEGESANGPGGELVTYPPDQARQSLLAPNTYASPRHRDSHFATLPNRSYAQEDVSEESSDEDSELPDQDTDSRYSKDYQFTIASPDEEMHGKAVALFDFARESVSELPLTEGQVIWVSFRYGQGWLVAEDPKTGESGLVPEEFVRLLRDIEGGWSALSGEQSTSEGGPSSPGATTMHDSVATPTQAEPGGHSLLPHGSNLGNGGEKRPPMVSTFSTSSKDLDPYPHHLLGEKAGGTPPQVVHYGSPTVTSPPPGPRGLRGFEEIKTSEEEEVEAQEESEAENDQRGKRQDLL